MIITGNEPAIPTTLHSDCDATRDKLRDAGYTRIGPYEFFHPGLTIRQQFAIAAMQGLAGTLSGQYEVKPATAQMLAKEAVMCADALIAELNKATENAMVSPAKTQEV